MRISKSKIALGVVLSFLLVGGIWFFVLGRSSIAAHYRDLGIMAFYSNEPDSLDLADKYFSRATRFNYKDPLAHYYLGRVAFGPAERATTSAVARPRADWAKAARHFEESIRLGIQKQSTAREEAKRVLFDLAGTYGRLSRHSEAAELLRRQIGQYPENTFAARYLLALYDYNFLNNPEEGLNVLLPAIDASDRIDSRMFWVYTLLANYYEYFEDGANVEKYARLALENAPSSDSTVFAHILLGITEIRKGNFSVGEQEFQTANQLFGSPKYYDCVLARAYFTGKNYTQAIEIAARAIESARPQSPAHASCLLALGGSYLALGSTNQARSFLEEYLKVASNLPAKNIFVRREIERVGAELREIASENK